jgi:hypothetical protein
MSSGKTTERIKKVMLTNNITRDKIRSGFVIFLSSMKIRLIQLPAGAGFCFTRRCYYVIEDHSPLIKKHTLNYLNRN